VNVKRKTKFLAQMFTEKSNWIVAETDAWIALNKAAGISVEKQRGVSDTLEDRVAAYLGQQNRHFFLGIVHRLDRPTSGLVLMAKKKSALKDLNQQFAERNIQKTYLALVQGTMPQAQGELQHYLLKDPAQKKAWSFDSPGPGRDLARLSYHLLDVKNENSLLEIALHTGRYHQIRAQLGAMGCPVLGDHLYGSTLSFTENAIALHAWKLLFSDPGSKKKLELVAEWGSGI
jgi:23S rRNA pseudouridine1911/1915/1917 synthase